jgi:hypothetical protein
MLARRAPAARFRRSTSTGQDRVHCLLGTLDQGKVPAALPGVDGDHAQLRERVAPPSDSPTYADHRIPGGPVAVQKRDSLGHGHEFFAAQSWEAAM